MFGGGGSSKQALALQQRQAAAAQRRQLAELATQQAEIDQAKASGSAGPRGRRLLTFLADTAALGSQSGGDTLGTPA